MNSEYLRKIKLFANEGSLQSVRHKIAAEHSLYRFDVHFFFVFNKNPVSTHSTVGLAAVAPGTAASNSMRLKMKNTFLLCLNHIQKLLNLLLMMKFTCRHPLTVQSKLVANIQIRIFGFNVRIEIPLFFFVCRNFSGHLAATQARQGGTAAWVGSHSSTKTTPLTPSSTHKHRWMVPKSAFNSIIRCFE